MTTPAYLPGVDATARRRGRRADQSARPIEHYRHTVRHCHRTVGRYLCVAA